MRRPTLLFALIFLALISFVGAKILAKSIVDVLRDPTQAVVGIFTGNSKESNDLTLTQSQMREIEDETVKAGMAAAAANMNQFLPKLINEEIQFDEIVYEGGMRLTYRYTLLSAQANELDPQRFREAWLEHFAGPACAEAAGFFLDRGAQIQYEFRGKEGAPFQTYTLTEELCFATTANSDEDTETYQSGDDAAVPGESQPLAEEGLSEAQDGLNAIFNDHQDTARLVEEVRQKFTINGHPLHPFIFRDLEGWMSDSKPIITTIDVLAADGSNYYSREIVRTSEGYITLDGEESYSYSFIGRLKNRIVAVISHNGGGGSGIFATLHLLDVFSDMAFEHDGDLYERINLKSIRQVSLGDRWREEISVEGNTVVVDGRSTQEPAARMRIEVTRP
jgi:hypothetical protein